LGVLPTENGGQKTSFFGVISEDFSHRSGMEQDIDNQKTFLLVANYNL